MPHEIGIGGVAAEAILMGASCNSSVKEKDLIFALKKRFGIPESTVKKAIHFAILGNLLESRGDEIFLNCQYLKV